MGKLVMVTGATSGIGKATAKLFAEKGYNLIITGRRAERLKDLKEILVSEFNCKCHYLCFDVRNKEEVETNINSLPEDFKNIDILINNAGLAAGLNRLQDGDLDHWNRMIDTNVKGLLYVSKVVLNTMIENRSGHIINVGSIAGREVYQNGNVYCATKHAVDAITKGTRLDALPYGIKVSSISPGLVNTEFSLVRFSGDQTKADNVYRDMIPLNAEDVAETIYFMATRPAHVNIDDVLILPTQQGNSTTVHRQE